MIKVWVLEGPVLRLRLASLLDLLMYGIRIMVCACAFCTPLLVESDCCAGVSLYVNSFFFCFLGVARRRAYTNIRHSCAVGVVLSCVA